MNQLKGWTLFHSMMLALTLFFFLSCGDTAEKKETACPSSCQAHATCNETSKVCECDAGYQKEGEACVLAVNHCQGITCSNHGSCVVQNASALCQCDAGYHVDGLECIQDVVSCEGVTCIENSTCKVSDGLASCECNMGYLHNKLLNTCVEDDRCATMDCQEGYYCFDGNCYLEDECSKQNPNGSCPLVNGIQFACKEGLCVTPNNGALEAGEVCNPAELSCANGLACMDIFDDGRFKCRSFCDLTTNNSCGSGVCAPYLDDFSRNTGICIMSDPECSTNSCPEGYTCETMIKVDVCKAQGTAKAQEDCNNQPSNTENTGCEAGLFCVGDYEEDKTCQELCNSKSGINTCSQGRCIALQDIENIVQNDDIGLCVDLPYLCETEAGYENNPRCPENNICVPLSQEMSVCIGDTCENHESCASNEGCTRNHTSKKTCIPAGNLALGQRDCKNPKSHEGETLEASELCEKGLVCIEFGSYNQCVQYCDPEQSNSCPENMNCIDLSTVDSEYPSGINGFCQ